MSEPQIAVLGSCNTDLTVAGARLPRPGETVTGGEFYRAGGGKGANQAIAASRAGARVSFMGRTGDDSMGRATRQRLREDDINVNGLLADPDAHTGVALILVDGQGENMISVAPGANHRITPGDVKDRAEIIGRSAVLLVQLELPLDAVEAALSVADAYDVLVVMDPAPVPEGGLPDRVVRGVDVLTPNEQEARQLAGCDEDATGRSAAAALLETGAGSVAVTLGEDGVLLAQQDGIESLSGAAADPVDTVGAGDCFAGVLAVGLAEGKSLRESAELAVCAAALSTETQGAQPAMPSRETIDERYKSQNMKP
ncbi:MAG: ribokinase [Planctomycetota bacterium]